MTLMIKNLSASAGEIRDLGSVPGSGRSPGGGTGNRLHYFCLENPMDRETCGLESIGLQESNRTEVT